MVSYTKELGYIFSLLIEKVINVYWKIKCKQYELSITIVIHQLKLIV